MRLLAESEGKGLSWSNRTTDKERLAQPFHIMMSSGSDSSWTTGTRSAGMQPERPHAWGCMGRWSTEQPHGG